MKYMIGIRYFIHRFCTPEWIIAPEVITFWDLTYVEAGHGVYYVNNEPIPVSRGSLLCIPAGSYRVAETDPGDVMCIYAYNIDLFNMGGDPPVIPLPLCSHVESDKTLTALLTRMDCVWALREPGFDLVALSILYQILYELIVNANGMTRPYGNEHVKRITAYILSHINQRVTPAELGAYASLNPSYLNTLVHAFTGRTLTDYVNHIRINVAENILHYENVTSQEVADRCGFSDVFYFSRTFKRHKGYPPSAVKRI